MVLGLADVDDDPVVGEVGDLALGHPGVEHALQLGGVDGGEELADRLAALQGELGPAEAEAHGGRHPGDPRHLVGDDRRERRGAGEAAAGLHGEVALEAAADLLGDRGLGRAGEDADEADQRHADDQRGGGGRRALRAAGRVLDGRAGPWTPSRGTKRPRMRMVGPARTGPTTIAAATSRSPPKPTTGTSSVSLPPRQPAVRLKAPRARATRPMAIRVLDGAGPLEGDVAQGGERRDPGRSDRRAERGHEGDDHADEQCDDDRRGPEGQALGGQVGAEAGERGGDALGEEQAEAQAEAGADEADHDRLDEHRAQDLAAAGADGAEQGQLAGALGDEDREGVRDHEHARRAGPCRRRSTGRSGRRRSRTARRWRAARRPRRR